MKILFILYFVLIFNVFNQSSIAYCPGSYQNSSGYPCMRYWNNSNFLCVESYNGNNLRDWNTNAALAIADKKYWHGCYDGDNYLSQSTQSGTEIRQYGIDSREPGGSASGVALTNPDGVLWCGLPNATKPSIPYLAVKKQNCPLGCTGKIGPGYCNVCYQGMGSTGSFPMSNQVSYGCSISPDSAHNYRYDGCYDTNGNLATSGPYLRKFACIQNSPPSAYNKEIKCGTRTIVKFQETVCQYGCANGACKSAPPVTTGPTIASPI